MSDDYREASRKNWAPLDGHHMTDDRIQVGCLQRIADATESMAKNYADLIRERDKYLRWFREEQAYRRHNERRIASLKGQITKLKKAKDTTP